MKLREFYSGGRGGVTEQSHGVLQGERREKQEVAVSSEGSIFTCPHCKASFMTRHPITGVG
jgi:hypothetical protein